MGNTLEIMGVVARLAISPLQPRWGKILNRKWNERPSGPIDAFLQSAREGRDHKYSNEVSQTRPLVRRFSELRN
jgi:hypothetical protein